jgi:hypothetical protein
MAVYEGARPRAFELPRRTPERARTRIRARRRSSRVGLTLAAILVCFLLALAYLTQTIHVAARSYDIDALLEERQRLERELQSVQTDLYRWGAEPAIVKRAAEAGLDRLGRTVRLAH